MSNFGGEGKTEKYPFDTKPEIFSIMKIFVQVERSIDLCTLVDSDHLPLDVEDRNLTRNVVISERESHEWEKVITKGSIFLK